ncbi:hypothetical protein DUNSADRAFT_16664 [Dunaliella salina]|uniref:Encoded protein n=1 Tax=Dunaliella salina TaxID=3046 RepID=A0ABQ7G345_DUNSA|nr:hypothetical protein DUNSADRAFT_16664 [Dunaliella salina]|eukprot:KAF5829030.1 hypothetical protein DUNSADRAFT_16664 [Dunaliella salina]
MRRCGRSGNSASSSSRECGSSSACPCSGSTGGFKSPRKSDPVATWVSPPRRVRFPDLWSWLTPRRMQAAGCGTQDLLGF